MTISGMRSANKNMRSESKKKASRYSRRSRGINSKKKRATRSDKGNNRKILLGIGSIAVLMLIYLGINNWRSVQDYLEALNIKNSAIEEVIPTELNNDGLERMILVVTRNDDRGDIVIDKVYSLTSNKEKGIRSVVYIPGGVYISLGYKEFSESSSVQNLYYAGETIATDLGISYAIWEIENFLGYEFDSYLWLDPEATEQFEKTSEIHEDEEAEKYLNRLVKISNPINLLLKREELGKISNFVFSNLDANELMSFLSQYNFSAFDDVLYTDFSNNDYIKKEIISSGDEASVLNKLAVDEEIRSVATQILSKDFEREQTKVEVYNGSAISGLASRFSRKVVNNGINVVRVDNTDKEFSETTIYVPREEDYANTIILLKGLLPLEPKIVNRRPEFLTTADVVIILGSDMKEEVGWLPQLTE